MRQLDQNQSKMENSNLSGVRRRKIAELVEERGSVAVRELCEQFGMSEATIRRDLRKLGETGVVARTHGGVMTNSNVIADLPNEERRLVRSEEKRRIGRAAIDMLAGDEVVFLDAGTTALSVADNAHRKPGCSYVTTCLGVARRLRSHEIANFIMIGGSYRSINDSFAGTLAIAELRSLTFDIVREVRPTLVEVVNTGAGDVLINGTVENPIGTTSVRTSVSSTAKTASPPDARRGYGRLIPRCAYQASVAASCAKIPFCASPSAIMLAIVLR